jgi:hypothetical protein
VTSAQLIAHWLLELNEPNLNPILNESRKLDESNCKELYAYEVKLASIWRPGKDGTFPVTFLIGVVRGPPMDGKEIRAKNDEINSGNCNVGSYKHTKVTAKTFQ